MKPGILLINLGTPKSPQANDVKKYLKEFLNDPCVINLPTVLRKILVNGLIVPFRYKQSAHAYKSIWTKQGSPLLVHTIKLKDKVRKQLPDVPVLFGMRYSEPSIEQALKTLKSLDVTHCYVIPLYPQYAESSTQTAVDEANYWGNKLKVKLNFKEPFYNDPGFIQAWKERIQAAQAGKNYDQLILSFHGLPEQHILKNSPQCKSCLSEHICKQTNLKHCYRAQCFNTAENVAKELGLTHDNYQVAFQSRLGRTKWIEPYTEQVVLNLAKQGKKHVLIACPAFVADCLETLEEIGIALNKSFRESGGETLTLVPALNDSPTWVNTVSDWCKQWLG